MITLGSYASLALFLGSSLVAD